MSVYKAISKVQGELAQSGISKDRNNQSQGYKFRGIDDVYNALSPLLAKHGLCVLPRMLSRSVEQITNNKGTLLFYVTVEAEFDLVASEDNSKHTIKTYGEAMDSGDKATNKAMSAAYKYACLQTFAIPTEGDNDADAHTHEVKAQPKIASRTGELVKSQPKWTPEQHKEIGAIFADIMRIGGETGENQIKKLRVEMKYDAPADVIDAASTLRLQWQDIEAQNLANTENHK